MAAVAKEYGVRVEVESDGVILRVAPNTAQETREPEEFATLAEWQAWRDRLDDLTPQERARTLLEPLGKNQYKRGLGRGPKA